MRHALSALLFLCASAALAQPPMIPPPPDRPAAKEAQPVPAAPKAGEPGKMRGLKGRTPADKLAAIPRFVTPRSVSAPAQFAVVPPRISYWGNNQYGICVSSQEAFSLGAWSARCLGPDKSVFVPDSVIIAWARQHGYLNGAYLTEVMDTMQRVGLTVNGVNYKDGPYYAVDYSRPTELQAALYVGPVNIAIDADALPSGAGSRSGWYATGGGRFPNTDHCVALAGYGPAVYLYQQLGVPLPAALPADTQGYLLFTWNTIGFVTQNWINSTCTEAYVRNPTTVGMTPPAPPPDPPVPPPPVPGAGFTGTLTYKDGALVAVTPGGAAPPVASLEADLKGAGVNPVIIADVLKLIADIRSKQSREVIIADVLKIILDLGGLTEPQAALWRPELFALVA